MRLSVRPDVTQATALLCERFVRGSHSSARQVREAVEDSYRRLMRPSLETELRASLKRRADDEAVRVFAANLKELLMAPPLGERRVLAIDPGYRTGCKVVCLDAQGRLLHDDLVYAAGSESQRSAARGRLAELVEEYEIQAIAIGNGTASRETEGLVRSLDLPDDVPVVMVNESGASVYSASETAREELPDYDVTVRGAASIGRRLQDPLAELVKIDPRSIGVGQYQHDVDQQLLRRTLDEVVERCVNAVGVEVNTASVSLLSRVSGIGKSLAESIVKARDESGPFASREELKKVRRLGPKAFEQAAGFLRIRGGAHPLDASAVHPESYHVVRRMANDVGCTVAELLRSPDRRAEIEVERYVTAEIGLPTLSDIMDELARPGRDPRQQFEPFSFSNEIQELDDVRPGMTLPGIVTNVVDFGAFVDLGVHQDGLVHVSEMAEHYVSRPSDVVKVGQRVLVRVLDVDLDRRRISLSLRL